MSKTESGLSHRAGERARAPRFHLSGEQSRRLSGDPAGFRERVRGQGLPEWELFGRVDEGGKLLELFHLVV